MEAHADYIYDLENQRSTELDKEDVELFFTKFSEFMQLPTTHATLDVIGDDDERYVRRCFVRLSGSSSELEYVELINWNRSVNGRYQEEFWMDVSSVYEGADMPLGTHYRFTKHDTDLIEAYTERIDVRNGGGWDRSRMTRYDMDELFGGMMTLDEQVQRISQYHASLD